MLLLIYFTNAGVFVIKGHLKLVILTIMQKKDVTGYEVAKEIKRITGVQPSFGSIYPILKSLVIQNLANTRKINNKKYYRITIEGRNTLKKIEDHKAEIIKHIREGMVLFQAISPADSEFFDHVIDCMHNDKLPLHSLGNVRLKIAKKLFELEKKGLVSKYNTKIKKIFNETLRKLNNIK
ncbi:MAG: PadR family transcriptional regulator [Candidatus Woesearchaeota archaeon]